MGLEPREPEQMEAMCLGTRFIVAPSGGLKDTVEDGALHDLWTDLWTDVKMTVEALVERESSRKSETAELGLPKEAPASVHWARCCDCVGLALQFASSNP